MSASEVGNAVLIVAIVVFVLYRQTKARPIVSRRLWILPGVLVILGISAISHVDHGRLSSTATTYLVIDLVSSAVLGAARGLTVRVFERDGVLWRRGGKATVGLWLVAIAVRAVIGILAARAGVGNISDAALEVALGLSLLGQNAVVGWRGQHSGVPFAVRT